MASISSLLGVGEKSRSQLRARLWITDPILSSERYTAKTEPAYETPGNTLQNFAAILQTSSSLFIQCEIEVQVYEWRQQRVGLGVYFNNYITA